MAENPRGSILRAWQFALPHRTALDRGRFAQTMTWSTASPGSRGREDSPARFLPGILERVISALAATAGPIWTRGRDGQLPQECLVNPPRALVVRKPQ